MDKRTIYTVECQTTNKTWSKDFRDVSKAKSYMKAMSGKYRASCFCRDLVNSLCNTTSAPSTPAVEQAKRDTHDWSDGRISEWMARGGRQEPGMTQELVAHLTSRYNR